jgi:hypothetical protein
LLTEQVVPPSASQTTTPAVQGLPVGQLWPPQPASTAPDEPPLEPAEVLAPLEDPPEVEPVEAPLLLAPEVLAPELEEPTVTRPLEEAPVPLEAEVAPVDDELWVPELAEPFTVPVEEEEWVPEAPLELLWLAVVPELPVAGVPLPLDEDPWEPELAPVMPVVVVLGAGFPQPTATVQSAAANNERRQRMKPPWVLVKIPAVLASDNHDIGRSHANRNGFARATAGNEPTG